MLSFFIFIVTVLILVGIHEWGHFIAARLLGVHVLRFSIGFGKPLVRWKAKNSGVEYAIGWIPLGGYVRLLNTREGEVPPSAEKYAFDRQSLSRRALIVFAGPFINLLFAWLAFCVVYSVGVHTIRPVIGQVIPASIAAKAGLTSGLEVKSIAGSVVYDWGSVMRSLVFQLGSRGTIAWEAKPLQSNTSEKYSVDLSTWQIDPLRPDLLKSLGIIPYRPLQGEKWPAGMRYERKYPVILVAWPALKEVVDYFQLNVVTIGKMLVGNISYKQLGGPLLIYQTASFAFKHGLIIFIHFLGIMSVMLAFINLLPVPGLDGCHLLYFAIEKITKKPLPLHVETLLVRLGMIFLVLLMLHVTVNDLARAI